MKKYRITLVDLDLNIAAQSYDTLIEAKEMYDKVTRTGKVEVAMLHEWRPSGWFRQSLFSSLR